MLNSKLWVCGYDVVTTSDEKKAPPSMERLQKDYCS